MRSFILVVIVIFFTSAIKGQATWNKTKIADGSTLQKMVVADENTAVIIGLNSIIKQTTDGGQSWHDVNLPDTLLKFDNDDVDYYDLKGKGDTLIATHKAINLGSGAVHDIYINSNLLLSTDAGTNWNLLNYSGISDASNNPTTDALADSSYAIDIKTVGIDPNGSLYIHASWTESNGTEQTKHSFIFRSDDLGSSWENLFNIDFEGTNIKTIYFEGNIGFIGGDSVLYKYDGSEWINLTSEMTAANGNESFYVYNFIPTNLNKTLIASTTDGVFYCDNEDDSFTHLSNLPKCFDLFYFNDGNILTVGLSSRTMLSRDFGETTEDVTANSTLYDAGGILNDSLYALGKDYIYTLSISDLNLYETINNPVYKQTELRQTGFNQFCLTSATEGKYELYNLGGQLIFNEKMNGGNTSVDLSAFDHGIYILRTIDIDYRVSVHKLIIQ